MQISLRPCLNMLENGKSVEKTSLSTMQVWLELYQRGSFVIQSIWLRIMVKLRINNKLGKHLFSSESLWPPQEEWYMLLTFKSKSLNICKYSMQILTQEQNFCWYNGIRNLRSRKNSLFVPKSGLNYRLPTFFKVSWLGQKRRSFNCGLSKHPLE